MPSINFALKKQIVKKYGTQRAFSEHVDINETIISDLVRGRRSPSDDTRRKIASALGVMVEDVFDNTELVTVGGGAE